MTERCPRRKTTRDGGPGPVRNVFAVPGRDGSYILAATAVDPPGSREVHRPRAERQRVCSPHERTVAADPRPGANAVIIAWVLRR